MKRSTMLCISINVIMLFIGIAFYVPIGSLYVGSLLLVFLSDNEKYAILIPMTFILINAAAYFCEIHEKSRASVILSFLGGSWGAFFGLVRGDDSIRSLIIRCLGIISIWMIIIYPLIIGIFF